MMSAKPHLTQRGSQAPYQTRDGSLIRELMHPALHAAQRQSLAEAELLANGATALHRHHRSEELYHFLSGSGWMTLGDERFAVRAGDTVCIAPGTAHRLECDGQGPMRLLCCCSPPYSHEDTELL